MSTFKNNRALLFIKTFTRKVKHSLKSPIRGSNNTIRNHGVMVNSKYDINGNNNLVEIGAGTVLTNFTIIINGDNHILRIGQKCRLNGGNVYYEDNNCTITIGDRTTIESIHIAATEPGRSVTIGSDCMLAYNIEIRTGDSHSIIDKDSGKRINFAKDITIEDKVWIAAGATILKGVTISTESVVGTGALVASNVPANSIVAGNPAKVVKENISWLRERIKEQ